MSRRSEAFAEARRDAAPRSVARHVALRSDARESESLRLDARTVLTLFALLVGACGASTATTTTTTPTEEEPGPELALALQLVEAAPDPEVDMPRSEVRVVLIDPSGQRSEESVGVFSGICQPAALSNALVGVSCWWAGSGDRIRARKEGDTVVVTRAQLDEAVEGELPEERLTTVTLPPRATLRPLTGVP
ncbi:MAG: hypothetical protein MUE69_16095 [Myxococcota bacterium]|jgi:hypothetical protein|nr:hypothetical protein [Myxococcota bacterium]